MSVDKLISRCIHFFLLKMCSKKCKSQKVEIIEAVKNISLKKKGIAIKFGIPCSTLSTILKNEKGIMMKKVAGGNSKTD